MRVQVYAGDGKTDLGKGEHVGCVDVYFFRFRDGSLGSNKNAEKKPSILFRLKLLVLGIKLVVDRNPKIILDTGKVVYGCQTYWKVIAEDNHI